jgi:dynein light chain roadblock-type
MSSAETAFAAAAAAAAAATPSNPKSKVHFQEVQETVSRLAAHKGVTAVLILNSAGDILTQTGGGDVSGNPKLLSKMLHAAAQYVHSIPNDDDDDEDAAKEPSTEDISFVRIRTQREEILVAPKNQYVLVVLQDPTLAPL